MTSIFRLWLIVLVSLVISGCGVAVQQVGGREISAHFLYHDTHTKKGGLGDLIVEVGPNPNRRAPVRFAETTSGGAGDAWRATVWMALLTASAYLDIAPNSIRITVEAGSPVDGPSAGIMVTSLIIAAYRGDQIRPDAILTGTVNPDMSVGPVGGLLSKMDAAIAGGKKWIGIPIGQRIELDSSRSRAVDVVAYVRAKGAHARVIRDVRDAYLLLTGKMLKKCPALAKSEMMLPKWAADNLILEAGKIVKRLEMFQKKMSGLTKSLTPGVQTRERQSIDDGIVEARRRIKRGEAVSAVYLAAQLQGRHFSFTTRVLSQLAGAYGHWNHVRQVLGVLQQFVAVSLQTGIPGWKAQQPRSALEVPYTVDTFEAFIHALNAIGQAREVLSKYKPLGRLLEDPSYTPLNKGVTTTIMAGLSVYTQHLVDAQVHAVLGGIYLGLQASRPDRERNRNARPIPQAVVEQLTRQYGNVTNANLQYMDSLLITQLAEQHKENPETTRLRLIQNDSDYRQAVINRRLPGLLRKDMLSPSQRSVATLSGTLSSYFASVTFVSKRYSMGLNSRHRSNPFHRMRIRTVLDSMLKLAETNARQVAAQCMNLLDEIPLNSLIEYDIARRMESDSRVNKGRALGGPDAVLHHRVVALQHYWRASTLGRLAIATHRRLMAISKKKRP